MLLAVVALVDATLLAALVLTLRHLAAMRATTGEMATLGAATDARAGVTDQALERLGAKLADLETRFIHLNNRIPR